MKKYLLTPNNIIVGTDYKRMTQTFLDKLRSKLKKEFPQYSDIIANNLNNAQLRFDLREILNIEYDDKKDFRIKKLKGQGWTKMVNGKAEYKKIKIYK